MTNYAHNRAFVFVFFFLILVYRFVLCLGSLRPGSEAELFMSRT